MAASKVIRRVTSTATGVNAGSGRAGGTFDIKLPADGSLNIRRAENGIIVTVWDSSKKYDDPDHERTIVVQSLSEIVLS